MERQLPIYMIEGTAFIVDIEQGALIEQANPVNIIYFSELSNKGTHYEMLYDLRDKNWPPGVGPMDEQMVNVRIPYMTVLDPEGMDLKYNKNIDEVKDKTDFEIIIDQDLYKRRLSGHLAVIEIMNHPFYVDVRMDSLRPKDDFTTLGIRYSEIEDYIHPDDQRYWIPYHPSSHTVKEIDTENITAIPKDIFLIEIPTLEKLDPVGYARHHGFDIEQIVMANPIEKNMVAKIIDWKETGLQQIIEKNLSKKQSKDVKDKIGEQPKKAIRRSRGHKM